MFDFSGSRDTSARLARIERKLDLILEALGVEATAPVNTPEAEAIGADLAGGRKISAIKRLRVASGAGLAEAKRAIEDGSWRDMLR